MQHAKQVSERQGDHHAAMAALQQMQLRERMQGAESRRLASGSPFASSPVRGGAGTAAHASAESAAGSDSDAGAPSSSMESMPSVFLRSFPSSSSQAATEVLATPGSSSPPPAHPSAQQTGTAAEHLRARLSPPRMRGPSQFHISQAKEETAESNRSRLIQSVVAAARSANSAAASKHALRSTAYARRTAAARADFNFRMAAAAERRREALQASAATARQHVRLVQARVMGSRKAATRLQRWWRAVCAAMAATGSSAPPPLSPDAAMVRVHFSPLQSPTRAHVSPALQGSGEAAALRSLGAMPSLDLDGGSAAESTPPRTHSRGVHTAQASPNSRAAHAALQAMAISSDATERIQAAQAVRRVFQSKGAQRACRVLLRVLSASYAVGHPDGVAPALLALPDDSQGPPLSLSLPGGGSGAGTPSNTAGPLTRAEPPYTSFDDCAAVLQERSAVSAAMHFAKLVKVSYPKLAPVVGFEGGGKGGQQRSSDSHAYSGSASDPASDGSLRPAIAQSPRTMLAALLLAWFPEDILGQAATGGVQGGSDERSEAELQLIDAARVMLQSLFQLCDAVRSMAPASHDTPVPTPTPAGGSRDPPDEYAALLERFSGTHEAEHVETLLQCTLLKPRDVAALPRRAVLLLHRVLAFNACHVEYMDQYMVWKLGDAASMAQSLAQPYARALQQAWHYQQKLQEHEPEHMQHSAVAPKASVGSTPSPAAPGAPAVGATSLGSVDWSALPPPVDDGAADHLQGRSVPPVQLQATGGDLASVDISSLHGTSVVFLFPMTGRPGQALPAGWDSIPGARGCTPQACAFRDLHRDLKAAGATHVFGLSTQSKTEQAEARGRLHLPFPLLSDAALRLASALSLPTFTADGVVRLKRMTLIVMNGSIAHVRYPVFPPDSDATAVLQWLREHAPQVAAAASAAKSQASPLQRPLEGGAVAYHQLHAAVQAQLATMDGQLQRLLGARGATRWVQHITQRTAEQWAAQHGGGQPPLAPPPAAAEGSGSEQSHTPRVPRQRPSARPTSAGPAGQQPDTPPSTAEVTGSTAEDQLPRSSRRGPSMALVKQVMSNAALAHSVMVDPDFALPSPPPPPGCDLQGAAEGEGGAGGLADGLLQLVRVEPAVPSGAGDAPADDAAVSAAARHMAMVLRLARGGVDGPPVTTGVGTSWRWGVAKAQHDTLQAGSSSLPSGKSHYASYWGDVLSLAVSQDGETGAGVVTEALQTVLSAVQALVPHRSDLHEDMQRIFDLPTVRRMLAARAMGLPEWWRIFSGLVQQLAQLEAPARAAEGKQWLQRVQHVFHALQARVAAGSDADAAVPLIHPAVQALLPVVLAWLHWRVALVQSDISNFQLGNLRPYLLLGGRGADYERKQWKVALAEQRVSVEGVLAWVRGVALSMIKSLPVAGGTAPEQAVVQRVAALRQLAGDSDLSRVCLLRDGMLRLIELPYAISQLAAAAAEPDVVRAGGMVPVTLLRGESGPAQQSSNGGDAEAIAFPGTLALDAKTLTDGQNTVQRTALVACLGMILDQFVSQLPAAAGSSGEAVSLPHMQEQVHAWLLDDSLRLPDLRAASLQLAQRRAAATGRLQVDDQQHEEHVRRLYALVDSAVSYEHALYSLCAQRVVVAVRHAVTSELQRQMPPGGAMNRAHENVFWQPFIGPPPASVAACVPATCAEDVSALAARLAGIARHSNAVHGALYQAALRQVVGGAVQHHAVAVNPPKQPAGAASSDVSSDEEEL